MQTKEAANDKDSSEDADQLVVPSFLRVMQAEQSLFENFVYEEDDAQLLVNMQLGKAFPLATPATKRLDDSTEADIDNENSIPQESSIAANVSF